ncbi:hypothetical protein BGX34_000746 [Mortierella sp. NVP85]|nr:hypothetical protein BGX34_000746 [Mortierella sp. NVP85]
MKIQSLAALLLCSSAAMAHYTLDYPLSRGFSDDNEPKAPCGGYDTVGNRTQFPLTKGFVTINSHHATANVKINVVLGDNPSAADFTAAAATPANTIKVDHPGVSCLPLDLSTFKGATDNTTATIQLIYEGGDNPLYQCADVVLVTSAASFNQSKCTDPPTKSSGAGAIVHAKSAAAAGAALLMAVVMAL